MKVMSTTIQASAPSVGQHELDDEVLVKQAQQQPSRFALLYDRHVTNVYRYLLVRVGSHEDAEDLTSQTFLTAMEQLGRYRGSGTFQAWLFRIARNKSIDHYRRHKRLVPMPSNGEWIDGAVLPDTAVERQLALDAVSHQLRNLAPDRAEVVSLRIFGQLETAEIADMLNKSETAVRMLLHRGVRDLQERLAPMAQEVSS